MIDPGGGEGVRGRQAAKLWRARSWLYRRQFLEVNIRLKALDEIYKIYTLLHHSDLIFLFSHYLKFISQCSGKILVKFSAKNIRFGKSEDVPKICEIMRKSKQIEVGVVQKCVDLVDLVEL